MGKTVNDPSYKELVARVFADVRQLLRVEANVAGPDIDILESVFSAGQPPTELELKRLEIVQGVMETLGSDEQQLALRQMIEGNRIMISLTAPAEEATLLVHPLFRPQAQMQVEAKPVTLIVVDFRGEKLTIQRNIPFSPRQVLVDTMEPDFKLHGADGEYFYFESADRFYIMIAPDVEDRGIVPSEDLQNFFYQRHMPQSVSFNGSGTQTLMGLWASILMGRSVFESMGFVGERATVDRIQFIAKSKTDGSTVIYPETPWHALGMDLFEEGGEEEDWSSLITERNPQEFGPISLDQKISRDTAAVAYRNFLTIAQTVKRLGMWMDENGWATLSVYLGEPLKATENDREVRPGDVRIDVTGVPHILRMQDLRTALSSPDGIQLHETTYYFPNIAAVSTQDPDITEGEKMVMRIQDLFRSFLGLSEPTADEVTDEAVIEFERYLQMNDFQHHLQLTDESRKIIGNIVRYYHKKLETTGLDMFVGLALFPILYNHEEAAWSNIAKGYIDAATIEASAGRNVAEYWRNVQNEIWEEFGAFIPNSGRGGRGNSGSNSANGRGPGGTGGLGGNPIGQASPITSASDAYAEIYGIDEEIEAAPEDGSEESGESVDDSAGVDDAFLDGGMAFIGEAFMPEATVLGP